MLSFDSANSCRKYMDENGISQFDIKFCDLVGSWHHITLLKNSVDERILEKGIGFDSSSIPRFRDVRSGDMAALPDLSACFIDPTFDIPTLSCVADIVEAGTAIKTSLDPRTILKKAVEYLKKSGIADDLMCAPELEFYLFDSVKFHTSQYESYYRLSAPGIGGSENSDYPASCKIREGDGYLTSFPRDSFQNERSIMAETIASAGFPVRYHHPEVGIAGQQEIEFGFSKALTAADGIMLGKYLVRSVALDFGLEACFLPKPIIDAPGSGLHIHLRLMKNNKNVLHDPKGYAGLSKLALQFIAGILYHGRALLAFMCPSTNSYKRLVPGHETPTRFFFSVANREAAIRIPKYSTGENTRCEFRPGDATMNPYLGIAALLMAGLDGIRQKMNPEKLKLGPFDGTPPEVESENELNRLLPESFGSSLTSLIEDRNFLLEGDVFSEEFIENFVFHKITNELEPVSESPHPLEYELYWGI